MNREIKFRGKRVDNDDWVYGSLLVKLGYRFFIVLNSPEIFLIPVRPETVGEFTNLKDKNKNEIFEHDQIGILLDCDRCESEDCECGWQENNKLMGFVKYKDGAFVIEYEGLTSDPLSEFAYGSYTKGVLDYVVITGNMHESEEINE